MKKISSILDYSYPNLDPAVWDQDMKLHAYQRDYILRLLEKMYSTYGLKDPKIWIDDVVILGSLTTSKWLLSSDLDLHIRVNLDAFIKTNMPKASNEEAFDHLDTIRKEWDRAHILLPMTQHPIEAYFESVEFKPSNTDMVGVYSLFTQTWLKAPILFPVDLDFEESKRSVVDQAEALAEELDSSFGKIKRDIQRINELDAVIKSWDKDKQKLFYTKIETKLNNIEEEIKKDLKIKQDLVDARHENQDATSDTEIKFKWLQRFGFFGILSNLKELLESTGGEVTTDELPLIEKIVSEASIKEVDTDICIDFDNTIAQDAKYPAIGEPIDGAKDSLTKLKDMGYSIIIYSCRGGTEEGVDLVREWLDKHEMPYDSIFAGVKPMAYRYIDDRAIKFDNWKSVLEQVEKSEKKASLCITSYERTHPAYWIDPSGTKYPVNTTHEDWFFENEKLLKDNYGYDKDTAGQSWWDIKTVNLLRQMLNDGWVRIGDLFGSGRKFLGNGVEIADLTNVPNSVFEYASNFGPGAYLMIEDLQHHWVELEVSVLLEGGQEAVDYALKQQNAANRAVAGTLKIEAAQWPAAFWISPDGKKYDALTHDMWMMDNAKLLKQKYNFDLSQYDRDDVFDAVNDLVRSGWTRVSISPNGKDYLAEVADVQSVPTVAIDVLLSSPGNNFFFESPDTRTPSQVTREELAEGQDEITRNIKRAKLFSKKEIIAEKSDLVEYSCVMANIPKDISQEIVEWGVRNVVDKNLYTENNLGRELDSHITIKYGILSDKPEQVEKLFKGLKSLKATLGEVKHFEPKDRDFDVLTISVESKDLEDLNEKITDEIKCATGLPSDKYHPHITIAYIKKGTCKELYGNKEFEGKEIVMDSVEFSPVEGDKTTFSIEKKNVKADLLFSINKLAVEQDYKSWIDPNGREYPFNSTHDMWIARNLSKLQKLGINTRGLPLFNPKVDGNDYVDEHLDVLLEIWKDMINAGWVRVTADEREVQFTFDVANLRSIPSFVEDFISQVFDANDGRGVSIGDLSGKYVIITDPIKGVQKEVNRALSSPTKTASGNNFLPSLVMPANNEWQFQHGGPDLEIALQPDPVSDDTTEAEPCTTGKPRTKEVWRQFLSIFDHPISKKDTEKISSHDPELEEAEAKAMGEETLLEFSKGFYDPKKHDFPKNTTWLNTTYQDQEPNKPLPVTYSPQTNEDNLDQNSPGGYPRRFMGKPKGEWFSNEGDVTNNLVQMFKNKESTIDNLTIDITAITKRYALYVGGKLAIRTLTYAKALAIVKQRFPKQFAEGNFEIKAEEYKIASSNVFFIETDSGLKVKVLKDPSIDQAMELYRSTRGQIHQLRWFVPSDGHLYMWDAYGLTHWDAIQQLGIPTDQLKEDVNSGVIYNSYEASSIVQQFQEGSLLTTKKQAGSYSASVPDYQGEEYYTEQHMDDTDEEPYVNHQERDYPYGMQDAPQSTNDFPWAKDITPYVVRLDLLQNPADRQFPFGMPDYEVSIFPFTYPQSDGIEATNPD